MNIIVQLTGDILRLAYLLAKIILSQLFKILQRIKPKLFLLLSE